MPRWSLAIYFLLISAAGTGSYIILTWLFTVLLRHSGWMAALLVLIIVVACALHIAVVSFLLDGLIVGAVFFGCGVLGCLAGFGLVSLYAAHSTALKALAIIATGLLMGVLMMFIRAFLLIDSEEELYAWWALAAYLGAEGGAFVCDDLIHHWHWWAVALVLVSGFLVIAHNVASHELSTESAFLLR